MNPKLIDILICPECKCNQLELQRIIFQKKDIWEGEIHCESCIQTYPIKDGIPCLLKKEQLETLKESILQEWLQKVKEVEKDVIDEDQETFKKLCQGINVKDKLNEDAERLFWEKKLYLDNKVLRKELRETHESKWTVAQDNINYRNNRVFSYIDEFERHDKWEQALNIGPGIDVDLITRLESRGINVINCDINLDSLKQLSQSNRGNNFSADLKSLPFNEGTFDVVFCFHVIHHVHPIEKALSEAKRVLKPGGKILILEMNTNQLIALQGKLLPISLKRLLRRLVRRLTKTSVRIYMPSPYEQVVPSKILINAMRKVGFDNIIRKTAVHPPMCFPDFILNSWNRLGFRFPKVFDPIAFEYYFSGTKFDADQHC